MMGRKKIQAKLDKMASAFDSQLTIIKRAVDGQSAFVKDRLDNIDARFHTGHVESERVHLDLSEQIADLERRKADKPPVWTDAQRAAFRSDVSKRGWETRRANAKERQATVRRIQARARRPR